jgi:hypothetical protein
MTLAPASARFEVIGVYIVDHETRLGYRSYSTEGAHKALSRILSGRDPLHHYTGTAVHYMTATAGRNPLP